VGGTIGLPYAFRVSPFMIFNSGSPYNVTVGQDLNHDSVVNDRPAFAATNDLSCLSLTVKCHYNPSPTASDVLVPINYLTGPTHFTLNLRLAKTFGFGPEKVGKAADGGPGPGGPPGGMGGGRGPGGGGPGGGGGGFRRGGGGGSFGLGAATNRRYNLTLSINARNLLNRVNAATPVGSLGSGFFGQSTDLARGPFSGGAANRKIELQAMFSF
jgi:hypothetical protein